MKVSLDKATVAQLRAFSDQYGLDHADRTTAAQLRALIAEALDVTEIDVEDEPEDEGPAAPRRPRKAAAAGPARTDGKLTIMIQEQDPQFVPGGDQPVFVSVNGSAMFIPRGEPVDVPAEFAHALGNARQMVYRQVQGEDGQPAGIGDPREVLAYPFQILG